MSESNTQKILFTSLLLTLSAFIWALAVSALPQQLRTALNTKKDTSTYETELIRVTRVIDGDTIELESGHRVRYIGVDTPEIRGEKGKKECFAQEAQEKNKELVLNKLVSLEKDVSEIDRYGRLLRYVYVEEEMINELLVREGYAFSASFPPDISKQDVFRSAERSAREVGKGLWSSCTIEHTTPSLQ